MKHVLVICDTPGNLAKSLKLVGQKAKIVFFTTAIEISQILSCDDLNIFDLILLSPINWKIPTTGPMLARHLRGRFQGPIVAVSNEAAWRSSMRGSCTHVLPDRDETTKFLHELLFSST